MISLLKTLQWLPVALRIKNIILRWSTNLLKVLPPPTCSGCITPVSTSFRSGHTGLSPPLTSDPAHVLVNSYSSFVSMIKTGFLRLAFPVFLQALLAVYFSTGLDGCNLHLCVVIQQVFTTLFYSRPWFSRCSYSSEQTKIPAPWILGVSEVSSRVRKNMKHPEEDRDEDSGSWDVRTLREPSRRR